MERVCRAVFAVALAAIVGCGRVGPVKVSVSGEVSHRGVPVADGVIRFVPEPGVTAPASVALIKAGTYVAAARGGLQAGTYRVEITAFRPAAEAATGRGAGDAGLQGMGAQYLPARFHEASEMRVTIDGSSRGRARHDFHLEE